VDRREVAMDDSDAAVQLNIWKIGARFVWKIIKIDFFFEFLKNMWKLWKILCYYILIKSRKTAYSHSDRYLAA
jgi:hypothetical protein